MADDPATGTSSTPAASPAAAALPADPTPAPEPTQAASDPKGSDAAPPKVEPAKAEPEAPLFTLPEDFKPPESAVTKFKDALKGSMVDGKLALTPQQVVDLYVDQARDANTAWQKMIADTNQANEATCKARFSAADLAAAESAVGWFSSFEPAFRDFSKRQLNDPVFVNAMRMVGEALGEDTFEPMTRGPATKDNRPLLQRAADKLYGKAN